MKKCCERSYQKGYDEGYGEGTDFASNEGFLQGKEEGEAEVESRINNMNLEELISLVKRSIGNSPGMLLVLKAELEDQFLGCTFKING